MRWLLVLLVRLLPLLLLLHVSLEQACHKGVVRGRHCGGRLRLLVEELKVQRMPVACLPLVLLHCSGEGA